ncbi:hypothetical protein LINGRAHAP2_LOCUS13237 [Linum grandiflorum]
MENKSSIGAATAGQEGEDRISTLPNEIIHQILYRLESGKQVAQLNILSKTWSNLIQSYPVLEFRATTPLREQRDAAAILKKLSQGTDLVEIVRIDTRLCKGFYYDFPERIWSFVAEFARLRELDIDFRDDSICCCCCSIVYTIPESFFTPNGKQFARLEILKLWNCGFDPYENLGCFSGLGSSLKVLCLHCVIFPNAEILNSMIDHASLLETLTLDNLDIDSDEWKLLIRNHPNLKIIQLSDLYIDLLEIGGIHSLKEVRVIRTTMEGFKIWSTPNLKVVHCEGVKGAGRVALTDFISTQIDKDCVADRLKDVKIGSS